MAVPDGPRDRVRVTDHRPQRASVSASRMEPAIELDLLGQLDPDVIEPASEIPIERRTATTAHQMVGGRVR